MSKRGKVEATPDTELSELERVAAHEAAPQPSFDPQALAKARQRHERVGQAAMAGGGDIIPRRRVTFVVDFTACEPGVFGEDFSITLRSLRSAEEMGALHGLSNEVEFGFALAKASVEQINGTVMSDDDRDFLWEALGTGGRQVVCAMYASSGMAPKEAMGKALRSHTIG